MNVLLFIAGTLLVLLVARDVFTAILVPGRTQRRFRFIPYYFHATWYVWSAAARRVRDEAARESCFAIYAPLAMLVLLGLWALGLMVGFSLIQVAFTPGPWPRAFFESIFASGARMFTAGVGEWARYATASKVLVVLVSATGLGFFTIVITYLPVLYQLFSRREAHVIMLDERAGSPVSAAALIQNHARRRAIGRLDELLEDWEKWSAELLESHVSYPMLSYYRSQHSDQSWLTAVAVIMDVCAMRMAGAGGIDQFQAEATLSMCLRAMRSISETLRIEPLSTYDNRLPLERCSVLADKLREWDLPDGGRDFWPRLSQVRESYEPTLAAMAAYFLIGLPEWIPAAMIEAPLEAVRS